MVKTGLAGKPAGGLLKAAKEHLIQMPLARKLFTVMKINMKTEQNMKHHGGEVEQKIEKTKKAI